MDTRPYFEYKVNKLLIIKPLAGERDDCLHFKKENLLSESN